MREIIVSFILVLGALSGTYHAIDPNDQHMWGSEVVFAPEDHVKWSLWQQLDTPPDTVFLGHSRMTRMDPDQWQERTGESGFNAAFGGAALPDLIAWASAIHDETPGTHLVLGLDGTLFAGERAIITDVSFIPPQPSIAIIPTMDGLIDAGLAVTKTGGAAYTDHGLRVPVGKYETYPGEHGLQARVDAALDGPGALARYQEPPSEEPGRFLDALTTSGWSLDQITVILMPMHPYAAAQVADTPLRQWEDTDLVPALLTACASGLRLHDARDITDYGGQADQFWDGLHLTTEGSSHLLDAMAGGSAIHPEC